MNPLVFKIIHLAGVMGLFTAIGAICLGGSKKAGNILHGISLVLILLAGFAILKAPPMGEYWWMIKLVLWVIIGAAPAMTKRMPKVVVLLITIACGIGAAYLGVMKSGAV